MALIEIPINKGYNYISFPAVSTDDFGTIFTNSGIKDSITSFEKYDAASSSFIPVSDIEYIEDVRGYLLFATSEGTITYEGTEYTITFEEFESRILKGWNLLGTGSNTLSPPYWCKIIDPITNTPTSQLEPTHAYWVNYDDCLPPKFPIDLTISLISLGLLMYSVHLTVQRYKMAKKEE